jgi:hypothetical protein
VKEDVREGADVAAITVRIFVAVFAPGPFSATKVTVYAAAAL